jgi:hypothetical protein
MDEYLIHQLPDPIGTTAIEHQHWRESYFFIAHERGSIGGDVPTIAPATYPYRQVMDALVMGRASGTQLFKRYERPYDGDPSTTTIGPVSIRVVEPFKKIELEVKDVEGGIDMELTFTARTPHYGLRRGRMMDNVGRLVWDQSHMLQSGRYDGRMVVAGKETIVEDWWGQRDHSWGVREHGKCPMWLWLALQFDDGMLGVWHWELANGARVYTDGCWAPADGSDPIPVIDFHHELDWTDGEGKPATWSGNWQDVVGLKGVCEVTLAGGRVITIENEGTWGVPYGALGGQHLCKVTTDDGREGNGMYEVTGVDHYRYFPKKS